jgi:hypothetical protein
MKRGAMPRLFRARVGVDWPATLADLRRARAGPSDKVKTIRTEPGDEPIAAPYPEIIQSWLENGFEEVGES